MKNLVIVESPTKARTIGKYLGDDYEIKSSMGHVMDLPKSKLGVDVDHNFKPEFEMMTDKKKIIDELKNAAKSAESIILATDPDREGEAIASHVRDMLSSSQKSRPKDDQPLAEKFQRIVFHEITKEAVEEALSKPRKIDDCLVDAQTARRVLDRLVGYKLSPLLWKKVRRGLSAGRVQSVALRLIVEREREIEKFKKENYWTIMALLRQVQSSKVKVQSEGTEFELFEINGEKIEVSETFNLYDGEYKITKTIIGNENKASEISLDLKIKQYEVSDVVKKEVKRSPQPPYTTSTLQQDAARRFGYSGKRTMSLAQKLYEEGFITYHRTDSLNLSKAAVSAMRDYVKKEFGEKFIPEVPRFYKTKQKSAQEAHEAIRPTRIQNSESIIQNDLGRDYARLYGLIWRRALASQMSDSITESTTVIVASKDKVYKLKTSGSVLVFEGFLKINPTALQDKKLPDFSVPDKLDIINSLAVKHESAPPPRYNDASLIAAMEAKEIGRPSTYAAIISTIEARRYVERGDPKTGSGKGFAPTTVGIAVNDFLVKNFSFIDDIPFTAKMENNLDDIAEGKEKWVPMIKSFYDTFSEKLEKTEGAERIKIEVEKTDQVCDLCKAPMVVRIGKFGKFLSCSRFPDCKFSKPFIEETGINCPKCPSGASGQAGKVIVKRTKKGRRFYGCSNYPNCDFAAWKLEDIKQSSNSPVNSSQNTQEESSKTEKN